MTKEITGWEESFNKEFEVSKGPGRFHEKETFPCEGGYCSTDVSEIKGFISKAIASAVEAREREIQEYARKMRKDVDEGTYCNKQDGEWKNGYDCAMYDILLIINPSKE